MPGIEDGQIRLEAWANFFLVISTAATTLVGLLFVVITLAADRLPASETRRIRHYLTPTVVCFGSVLLLSGLLTIPTHSRLSIALCCAVLGFSGMAYALSLLRGLRDDRFLDRTDVWKYAVLPAAAYGLLVAGGGTLYAASSSAGLTLIAVAMLGLIALALRNSWSIAVSIVSTSRS
jgi:hypothetical protein